MSQSRTKGMGRPKSKTTGPLRYLRGALRQSREVLDEIDDLESCFAEAITNGDLTAEEATAVRGFITFLRDSPKYEARPVRYSVAAKTAAQQLGTTTELLGKLVRGGQVDGYVKTTRGGRHVTMIYEDQLEKLRRETLRVV